MTGQTPSPAHDRFIDCVRGYAVLLVIATHVTDIFVELPYPVRRLTQTGWFGVQLFFLASAVTLLMSWNRELDRKAKVSIGGFYMRRFFRIAPAYYAAGILYYFVFPPAHFDVAQALRVMAFVNAWHPAWMSTTGDWIVVPGGWSIGVEFSFYAIFPLCAVFVTSLRRAVIALIGALGLGVTANLMALHAMLPLYGAPSVRNFLFFWFPNQASVFAAGFVLFFLLHDARPERVRLRLWLGRHATPAACLAVLLFAALAYLPQGHFLGDVPYLPAGLAVCVPMMIFVLALAAGPTPFVNQAAAALGTVSFSAYLIHFAVIQLVLLAPMFFHVHAVGLTAILAFGGAIVVVVPITYALALMSYRLIEAPMIDLAKSWQRHVDAASFSKT